MSSDHTPERDALLDAFLQPNNKSEMERFILDLCTPAELKAFEERWRVACLLDEGTLSYRDIYKETGVSLTTIGRVARFLNQEPHQGYTLALNKLRSKKKRSK